MIEKTTRQIRALGLSSGGLDSILSAMILKAQNIDVTWVTFETPFFSPDAALKASEQTGIPLIVEEITDIYMGMLKSPPAGYGKNMNPCMDCHALMFSLAGRFMEKQGFDFLFSGEVLGQRPMSQTRNSMNYVEKHSGFKGRILRPLSAKVIPETLMEAQGMVDREKLYAITGRSRKPQMDLAASLGILDYPPSGGGCLLTDKGFSDRLRDMLHIQKTYGKRDMYLLRHGRHLRLDNKTKIVVGRSQADNIQIARMFNPDTDLLIKHNALPGPTVLAPLNISRTNLYKAGAICAGYTKTAPGDAAKIQVLSRGLEEILSVAAIEPSTLKSLMI